MREILFRGKRLDNGGLIEGNLLFSEDSDKDFRAIIIPTKNSDMYTDRDEKDLGVECWFKVAPETVCQYTGLTDKTGRKIFEGDIVKAGGNLVVKWNEKFASWCLSKEGWMYNHFFGEAVAPEDCEVIGNIFDNPDLLTTSSTDSD